MVTARGNVKVSILGKDFLVACGDEERDELMAAVTYLDKQMRVIQRGGKVVGIERLAVMAALNISHELLQQRSCAEVASDTDARIGALTKKIDAALQEQRQLSL